MILYSDRSMFKVRRFEAKNSMFEFEFIGCSKNDVRVSSMKNLVHLALLGSMFDVCSFKAKSKVFEFDYQ